MLLFFNGGSTGLLFCGMCNFCTGHCGIFSPIFIRTLPIRLGCGIMGSSFISTPYPAPHENTPNKRHNHRERIPNYFPYAFEYRFKFPLVLVFHLSSPYRSVNFAMSRALRLDSLHCIPNKTFLWFSFGSSKL